MKFMKILFLVVMMLGSLISISAYSWINVWIGLEMNLLAFVPLIVLDNYKQSSETSVKYFLIQASGSLIIMFAFIFSFYTNSPFEQLNHTSKFMFNCALLLKMGAAPFHIWYPELIEGLSWMNSLILMTWQKIAPMILVLYNFEMNVYFCIIILLSMAISGLNAWNQTSLKKIMALSSINHIGWMMSMMFLDQSLWIMYFLVYFFITTNFILVMNKFNIENVSEMFALFNLNKSTKFFFFLNLFSLGGIPPFLGFFPKWMALKIMLENDMFLLAFIMIFLTLMSMYVYIRLIFQPLILKASEKKKMFDSKKVSFIYFMNFMNVIGLIIFTITFNMY